MDLSKTTEIKLLYRKQRQFSIYPKNNNRRAVMAEGENSCRKAQWICRDRGKKPAAPLWNESVNHFRRRPSTAHMLTNIGLHHAQVLLLSAHGHQDRLLLSSKHCDCPVFDRNKNVTQFAYQQEREQRSSCCRTVKTSGAFIPCVSTEQYLDAGLDARIYSAKRSRRSRTLL